MGRVIETNVTEEDVYIWEDELNYMEWTLLLEELRNKKKYIIKRFPLTTTTYQSTELQTFVCKIFGTNTKHTAPPTREKGIIPLSFIIYIFSDC